MFFLCVCVYRHKYNLITRPTVTVGYVMLFFVHLQLSHCSPWPQGVNISLLDRGAKQATFQAQVE